MRSLGERGSVMKTKSSIAMSPLRRLSVHLALVVLSLPFILPLAWMVSTSLKDDRQIYAGEGQQVGAFTLGSLVPDPIEWGNYYEAITAVPFGTYLRNTIYLCVMNVVAVVLSSAVVAYGFARLRFPGRDVLFFVMISTMALPPQVTMIPIFALFRYIGWYGTYLPLIVPYFFATPFFVFLLCQFFKTIPEELAESARIDGAGEWMIFLRIMLPLCIPAMATCALFQFLYSWNDFFGPLLYINDPSRYTIAYGLQQFLSNYEGKWAELMAGATIFTLPVIVLFFLAQRTFIQGIATTGFKG